MSFLPGVNDTAGYEENERGKPIQVPELQNKHLKRCIKSFHFISQWLKLFSLQRKLSSIQIHRISLGIAYLLWVNIGRQAVLVLEAALPKHSGAFGRPSLSLVIETLLLLHRISAPWWSLGDFATWASH